ncbi:MAG: threo-3-hydroxy-L-aspartate ammonia-lyase [Bacteroidetes bacterium]|jgi:threonine dehydratase|nr:threo-3-hydroxy-L-aspartate ammonia-lyase [Bacteroidota bacterium]
MPPPDITTTLPDDAPTYDDVAAADRRLHGIVNRTPVMTSRTLNARTGASVVLKCENFQRTGAFKFRGAYNAMSRLSDDDQRRGVLTYSSGNHAQAVALAGQLLGIPTTIIMPNDAPAVKRAATEGYGATVIEYDRAETTREALARKIAEERELPIIPPYDHPHIIAGQGTTAKELFEDTDALDVLLVCCGGGGLLSGSALAAGALAPRCRVIGVEPARADDATRSFHSGTLHTVHNPDTIADGARTPYLGRYTFPLVLQHADDMVTVSENALRDAMRFLWERMKLVVEPTGALAVAALLSEAVEVQGRRVGAVISGGNVDLERALSLVCGAEPMPSANR